MRIGIITPAPPRSRYGNRVTALRWARLLRQLGHRVTVAQACAGAAYDLLIALHARRSHDSITNFRRDYPNAPVIVALTGTDLYHDLSVSHQVRQSLDLATRIVVLQPKAVADLPPHLQHKTRVIYQSAKPENPDARRQTSRARGFQVCVIGHLREVKDPFRTALAARLLPASSEIRVVHIGGAMEEEMEVGARTEMKSNPRYRWLGEQPRWRTQRILEQSRLCVLSSRLEGGANVLSEAIAAGVPIIASRIPGSIGILGEHYPGYFGVGRTRELTSLLRRAETDSAFLVELQTRCRSLVPLFDPAHEQRAWADLLEEVIDQVDG
ncbi:MAG: TIGR04348 family glycosyltransferase [Acidobacteriota bacterium]|nr:TIGR04348 family glycosyltransferase [Acidobacteriota bacterium]